ncbi:MAG TPA: HAMP domain-containing sensor histidine kinase [Candidatus Acidoferrales bacterium]|nr:HAMP domain-containing sensor histidine kinase [Candidatus Acidoferrales bacterium]
MTPEVANAQRWQRLERAGWLLWGVTFLLLIALTLSLPALYVPLCELLGREGSPLPAPDPWVTTISLLGLVVLFCLYTVTKQREINLMRRALDREEREHEDVSTRLSELSALFQLSTALQLQIRLEMVLEIIVRRLVATLRAQQASIMIVDPETQELVTRATYGLEAELSRGARARLGEGIAGRVAERREGLLLGRRPPDGELGRHYKLDRDITSALSLPLAIGERVIGVLNVNRINHPQPFDQHHLQLLQVFGQHIAAVIDRAETLERLGTRARQLEADNEKLAEMNRMKDVFLSTASHELKTPLSSVIAYAELLDDNEGRLTRDQAREFVGRLRGEAMRLLGLIDDILDLSRLESGKLTLKPRRITLAEVADGALETVRPMSERYGVSLASELDRTLPEQDLDEVKVRQVIVNLLVNAVKFSPRGSRVVLRTRPDGTFSRLEVHDEGPGVAAEAATHIFELFGQGAGEENGARGGLGIGLHLVKRLSELHGGHVGVTSRPNEGSTFWVRLPIRPVPAAAEPEQRAA